MTTKEQLLQEINSAPESLLVEMLVFLRALREKELANRSTGKSLLAHLDTIGTWEGNDFEECLQVISDTRLPAEFDVRPNPFD
jgi:hypothetical protein